MLEERFWELIALLDWEQSGDDAAVIEPLVLALSGLSIADLQDFSEI